VLLTHGDWPEASPENTRLHREMRHRWRAALIRLQQAFAAPLVDLRAHTLHLEAEYVPRNLLVNGDFESEEKGRYEGVAYGWEPNAGKAMPDVHGFDEEITCHHKSKRSQRIAKPKDWMHYAIQRWTSEVEPLIEPGKRYRLSGWLGDCESGRMVQARALGGG
jgi:hypothetical protein